MRHRLVLCEACDLVYADPAPSLEFLHKEYEKSSFDSSEEAAYAARSYKSYLPTIFKGKALDIGCGGGEFLGEILKLGFTKIEGIEPSPAAIETAAGNVKTHIRQGLFAPENYQEYSYSLISCFQTMEHVTDPLMLSKAVYQLLKKDGIYYTVSHNVRGNVNRLLGTSSPIYDIEHMQLFSPHSLKCLLKEAGFTNIRIFPIWNTYPLHYWIKMLPLPKGLKKTLIRLSKQLYFGAIPIPLPIGNMVAIATK